MINSLRITVIVCGVSSKGCVYFGEELKSAMLIEPTETETKETLDDLIETLRKVLSEMINDKELVETAPHFASIGKVEARAKEVESSDVKGAA